MQDKKFGFGTYWYPDGTVYKGHWFQGKKHQEGELYENNGRVYKTEYDKNRLLRKDDITHLKKPVNKKGHKYARN